MDEKLQRHLSRLESLLFLHGEPLSVKRAADVLGVGEEEMKNIVAAYRSQLADASRGLAVIEDGGMLQLATRGEHAALLADFMKAELKGDLSPASVEALAIILYFGPVPRSRVDFLRGVNSSFTLRNLLIRGLVDRAPDPSRPNQYLYTASFATLRHLNIGSREELPEFAAIRKKLERLSFSPETQELTPAADAALEP